MNDTMVSRGRPQRVAAIGLLLTLLALASSMVMSCAGTKVRDEVGVPAALAAWPDVKKDVERGLAEAIENWPLDDREADIARRSIDELDAALRSGNRGAILYTAWLPLENLAKFGIEQRVNKGEIGSGVALSLLERLNQFRGLLMKLTERTN